MVYNPYHQFGAGAGGHGGMPGMTGMPGMQGQYNPYMGMGMGMAGQYPMMAQGGAAGMMSPGGMGEAATSGGGLQPFDSSKMKQGRMGHYGYLEGRGELLSTKDRMETLNLCRTSWSTRWPCTRWYATTLSFYRVTEIHRYPHFRPVAVPKPVHLDRVLYGHRPILHRLLQQ